MKKMLMAVTAVLICSGLLNVSQAVTVQDDPDEGQMAFKVTTANATFFLQKQAGGLSSLDDKDGKDWISANSKGGASGMYRGIPNLVFPGDIFHPMHKNCTCTKKSATNQKVTIECTSSKLGGWALVYDFYDDRADLTVTKKGDSRYWFLYEGTPNGKFSGSTNYLFRSDKKQKTALSATFTTDIKPASGESHEWVYFSDNAASRGLLLIHHDDDNLDDHYRPMNPMTVFGFGRGGRKMEIVPNKFSVLLVETTSWDKIAKIAKDVVDGNAVSNKMLSMKESAAKQAMIRQTSPHTITTNMGSNKPYSVRIVDMSGRVVLHKQNVKGSQTFSSADIGSGLFYAHVKSQHGNVRNKSCVAFLVK